jgi:hypothetical protein
VKEEGHGVFSKPDDVFVQYFLGDELELEQGRLPKVRPTRPWSYQCALCSVIFRNMVKQEGHGVFSKPDDVFVQYFLGDKLELEQGRLP